MNQGAINDSNITLKSEDNKNKNKNDLKTLVKSKSKIYDINRKEIFIKVDEILKELQIFENNLITFKKNILKNMEQKHF